MVINDLQDERDDYFEDDESAGYCMQRHHDEEAHGMHPRESYELRKEVRGAWAEEVRGMVLGEKALG